MSGAERTRAFIKSFETRGFFERGDHFKGVAEDIEAMHARLSLLEAQGRAGPEPRASAVDPSAAVPGREGSALSRMELVARMAREFREEPTDIDVCGASAALVAATDALLREPSEAEEIDFCNAVVANGTPKFIAEVRAALSAFLASRRRRLS